MKTQWEIMLSPTPRIVSVHKSRFAVVVLVECWIETVYYYVSGNKLDQLLTRRTLLNVDIHGLRDACA